MLPIVGFGQTDEQERSLVQVLLRDVRARLLALQDGARQLLFDVGIVTDIDRSRPAKRTQNPVPIPQRSADLDLIQVEGKAPDGVGGDQRLFGHKKGQGLAQAIQAGKVGEWLTSLTPQTDEYRELSKLHLAYLQIAQG